MPKKSTMEIGDVCNISELEDNAVNPKECLDKSEEESMSEDSDEEESRGCLSNNDEIPPRTTPKTFTCDICGKTLANSSSMSKHKKIHLSR